MAADEQALAEAFKRFSGYVSQFRKGDFVITPEASERIKVGNPKWVEDAVADARKRGIPDDVTTFRMNRYCRDDGDHEIIVGACHCGIVVGVSEDDIRPYINLAMAFCPARCWDKYAYLEDTGFLPGR